MSLDWCILIRPVSVHPLSTGDYQRGLDSPRMIRRKKKPDCIRVNFVQSASSKRRRIKIKHVSYPINWTPSSLHTPSPTCDLSGDGEEDSGGEPGETERPVAAYLGSHRVRRRKLQKHGPRFVRRLHQPSYLH